MTSTSTPGTLTPATLTPDSPAPPARRSVPVDRQPRRIHLGRRGRRGLLVAHVLSSVGWFGAAVMVLFLFLVAGSSAAGDARTTYRVIETSLWISVPAAALSAVTGVVLGLGTPWGLAKHWWVVLKEIAFVPLLVTDLFVVGPSVHDAARGGSTGGIQPVVAHCVVLALATVISVLKPFGRTPRGRRRVPSRG